MSGKEKKYRIGSGSAASRRFSIEVSMLMLRARQAKDKGQTECLSEYAGLARMYHGLDMEERRIRSRKKVISKEQGLEVGF